MSVDGISNPVAFGATNATAASNPEEERTSTADQVIGSDFETFLTMLTTQMQYQDPLNPVESSDFAVQLATFSSVEQQVLTNELLSELTGDGGLTSLADYAPWVGMQALASGPVEFDGAPVTINIDAPDTARTVELVVRNSTGGEVDRRNVDGLDGVYSWDGLRSDGTLLPDGTYTLQLEVVDGVTNTTSLRNVDAYALVEEARAGTAGPELQLAGNRTVAVEAVQALRSTSADLAPPAWIGAIPSTSGTDEAPAQTPQSAAADPVTSVTGI